MSGPLPDGFVWQEGARNDSSIHIFIISWGIFQNWRTDQFHLISGWLQTNFIQFFLVFPSYITMFSHKNREFLVNPLWIRWIGAFASGISHCSKTSTKSRRSFWSHSRACSGSTQPVPKGDGRAKGGWKQSKTSPGRERWESYEVQIV